MAEVKTIKIDVDTKQAVNAMENLSKATNDVNKSFEEVYGDLQPLTTRMGEAEDRLYELANAGQTATQEYQDLLETVGNYRKVQIQTDMAVDAAATTMTQKLGGALGGATAGFELMQGVMGTFGAESQEVEKLLLKVQSAMAISQGIQGVREAIPAITAFGTAIKTQAIAALTTLKGALIATGIGALVVALGFAANAMGLFSDSSEDAEKKQKKLDDQLEKTNKSLEEQRNFYDKLSASMEQSTRKQILDARKRGATEEEITDITTKGIERRIELLKIEEEQARKTMLQKSKDRNASYKEYEAADDAYQAAIKRTEELQLQLDEQRQAEKEAQDQINKDNAKANKEKRKEELAKLREYNREATDLFKSEYEKQVRDIREKYAEQIALAKKYKQDTTALEAAQTQELEDALDKSMKSLETLSLQKVQIQQRDLGTLQGSINQELKLKQEAADLELLQLQVKAQRARKIEEQSQSFKVKAVQDGLSAIASITELFGKKSEKAAKRAFQVQKAANMASALISTYQNATAAYASQFTPLPTPDSPIRGGIAAGIAVATGLANVAKIAQQKFESPSTGGGGGSTGSAGGGGVMSPNFNIVGNSGFNQLAQIQQQPIQAYVVSGEVTSAQALDRNRIKNATL
jgi:hypothetical protein